MERGYYGKEVNLAVMLCLVEKKTGFLCVNYVCVRVRCYLYFSLCMCMRLSHHLPLHHRIRVCDVCTFVTETLLSFRAHLHICRAESIRTHKNSELLV